MITINVKEKIKELSTILDELDDFDNNIPDLQQNIDYRLSDLYHTLENMTLDSKKCYRLCKELKQVLIERRNLKNQVALFNTYKTQIQKLINGKENRQLLLSFIGTTEKKLNGTYKNRVYTEEEIKEMLGV